MLDAHTQVRFSFGYRTITDRDGHFLFDRVLPGTQSVAREVGFLGMPLQTQPLMALFQTSSK